MLLSSGRLLGCPGGSGAFGLFYLLDEGDVVSATGGGGGSDGGVLLLVLATGVARAGHDEEDEEDGDSSDDDADALLRSSVRAEWTREWGRTAPRGRFVHQLLVVPAACPFDVPPTLVTPLATITKITLLVSLDLAAGNGLNSLCIPVENGLLMIVEASLPAI